MPNQNRLLDILADIKADDADVAAAMPIGSEPAPTGLEESAKYRAIVDLLHREPMLVQPCLTWLEAKESEMALAKLRTLYTAEELQAMVPK